jgi:Spy/CpxP family protein refolding chaperone
LTLLRYLRPLLLGGLLLSVASLAHAQGRGGRGGMMGGGGFHMGDRDLGDHGPPGAVPPMHNGPMFALSGRFWDDKKTAKNLNLRPEQQKRMDDLFDANKDNLVSLFDNLQREQQRYHSMSREDMQDESKVFAQIDRVSQARADLEKAKAHLLLQIRKEMDPQQLDELDREIASARESR